jgi:hypothetical protein
VAKSQGEYTMLTCIAFVLTSFSIICLGGGGFSMSYPLPHAPPGCIYVVKCFQTFHELIDIRPSVRPIENNAKKRKTKQIAKSTSNLTIFIVNVTKIISQDVTFDYIRIKETEKKGS